MDFVYTVAAFAVVPGILGLFHWLSRTPGREGPAEASPPAGGPAGAAGRTIAEEAENWLRAQR